MKLTLYGAGLGLLLAGCADPQLGDLQQQLAEVRGATEPSDPGHVESLVLSGSADSLAVGYSLGHRRSPFKSQQAEPTVEPSDNGELTHDLERIYEPLEAYELAMLKLVGTLVLGGEAHGLVRAPDGRVHRVETGSYLGRNQGRVISIGAAAIQLVELVPGSGRGWAERSASLSLEMPAR